MNDQPQISPVSTLAFRSLLGWVAGLGVCAVIVMATMAYGPSGFGFGVVIAALVLMLMVRRYRFSLRTFFIFTTVLGVWLGIKVGRDVKLQRAITTIVNAGGQLKIHDRAPNFPWGMWADRYDLSCYNSNTPLSNDQVLQLGALAPSSVYHLDLTNSGIADEGIRVVGHLTGIEFLLLANQTYYDGNRIPGKPQNVITDDGVERILALKRLRGIDLSGTDITDASAVHFLEMPKLIWIVSVRRTHT
jgi:hypothetical protein